MGRHLFRRVPLRLPSPVLLVSTCVLVLAVAPATLSAQNYSQDDGAGDHRSNVTHSVAYTENTLHLRVRRAVPQDAQNLPAATTRMAQSIDDDIAERFVEAVAPLRVDSLNTAEDLFTTRDDLAVRLSELAGSYHSRTVRRASNLDWVEVEYRYRLFPDLARLFIEHSRPAPLAPVLRWVPTASYTGIVIYAQEALPVHGEGTETQLKPALFPEIYDENLRRVLGAELMEPQVLAERGVVGYSTSLDSNSYVDRVGDSPLHVMATGIFGSYDTDIIVHPSDANRMLATEHMRSLLREGRVAVIISDLD